MLNNTRLQNFKKQIFDRLDTQSTVPPVKAQYDKLRTPYCWVELADPDEYETARDETGAVPQTNGEVIYSGKCGFDVFAWVSAAPDTDQEGTLYDEATAALEVLEDAIKYGAAPGSFYGTNYDVHVNAIVPGLSLAHVDPANNKALVWVHGTIEYTQIDK